MEWKELWKLGKDNGIQQHEKEWKEVIELLNDKDTVIEIGSYAGGSTFTLAETVKEVICIDPINRWDAGRYKNITKFVGYSHDEKDNVKEYLGRRKASMLIIDGDHSKESVLRDYELYEPLVKKGGVIVFHDIVDTHEHRRQGCFVNLAWDEIKDADSIEILADKDQTWGGTGIIFKV